MFSIQRELPICLSQVRTPPIKCQGIKSKIVPFILSNIKWNGKGVWRDPFMGSGVVSFNCASQKAVLTDINPHLINFYSAVKNGSITGPRIREFLEFHGKKLESSGIGITSYYYEMRDQFNENHDSLYFLFLNRSAFNGLIRFNNKGNFNSPFNKIVTRFSQQYITKIINQVLWVAQVIHTRGYFFRCCDWRDAIDGVSENDFVYLDPPYYGRNTTYYDTWNEHDELQLVNKVKTLPCGYALSSWVSDGYKENPLIPLHFKDHIIRKVAHQYFVGPKEENRPKMVEALIIKPGWAKK